MIDAVIQGRMHGTAKTRTGKNDKPFTTAMVRTATRDRRDVSGQPADRVEISKLTSKI